MSTSSAVRRTFAIAAICAIIGAAAIAAIGRAVDSETAHYVTFTRHGITLTCERIVDIAGRAFYDSCERVP